MFCERGRHDCRWSNDSRPVEKKEFNCTPERQVIQHQHVVRHQHDIINEYDVVHQHEYNYYDVVKNRDVVTHNDCTTHRQNYCDEKPCGCDG